MSILSRLFGSRNLIARPESEGPQQAVLVHLDGVGLAEDVCEQYDLATLEDRLEAALQQHGLGEYDGNELPGHYHVARIVASRAEDCGTCVQHEVSLAREAGVPAEVLRAVLHDCPADLPVEHSDAYHFARGRGGDRRSGDSPGADPGPLG